MPLDWTRYWIPHEDQPALETDGFLTEPFYTGSDNRRVRLHNKRARTFAELDSIPCLVLLGEAGIGKTTELARASREARERGEAVHHVRLGSIASEYRLDTRLLERPEVRAWRERAEPLTLFLDAFDEGLLRLDNAAVALREGLFEDLPCTDAERRRFAQALKLRITCRPDEWPASLTRSFQDVWGRESVRVLRLAPLRRADVVQAARAQSLDADAFLRAVRDAEAGPLAAVPLTLFALLDAFEQDGRLPRSKAALYERAARLLCDEHNEDRREAGRTGALDADRRMVVAARLAALMRFGAKVELDPNAAHYLGVDPRPSDIFSVEEVEGIDRAPHGGPFVVDSENIRDTTRYAGLLTAAADGRVRWTHEAYADFLAAWYLRHRSASPEQVWSLLTAPATDRVVPQLRAVAAWAATLVPGIFERLLPHEPLLAVAGDPQALADDQRETAVEAVLEGYRRGDLHEFRDGLRSYRPLRHPHLADQLRRWITDPAVSEQARTMAIVIASQNGLDELGLEPDITALALDPAQPPGVRIQAAYALEDAARAGRPIVIAALRPLALTPDEHDSESRVLHIARRALWPSELSFAELLTSLRADTLYTGDDRDTVVRSDEFEHDDLSDTHLGDALAWLEEGRREDQEAGSAQEVAQQEFPDLAVSVVAAALRRLDLPGVPERVAPLLLDMAGERGEDRLPWRARERLQRVIGDCPTSRPLQRSLASHLVNLPESQRRFALHTISYDYRLFKPEDVPWLVDEIKNTPDKPIRAFFLDQLRWFVLLHEQRPAERLEEAYGALSAVRGEVPELDALAREAFDAWELDSDRAREAKEHNEERRRDRTHRPPLDPPLETRIEEHLPTALTGNEVAFRELCYCLTLRPHDNAHRDGGDDAHDVTKLAGWKALDETYHHRILLAADAYLRQVRPDEEDWDAWADGKETFRILNAAKALFLLHRFRPDLLDALPAEAWGAWAPTLALHPASGHEGAFQAYQDLVQRAFHASPEALRVAVRRALPLLSFETLALVRALIPLSDPDVEEILLAWTERGEEDSYDTVYTLEHLLRHGSTAAAAAVERRIENADSEAERARWTLRLFFVDPKRAWDAIADRFDRNEPFARALLEAFADNHLRSELRADTPPAALLALARRLPELYPPDEDPPRPKGAYSPTTPHNIRDLRGGFTRGLASLGIPEALDALATLQSEQPEHDISWWLREGEEQALTNAFCPLPPADLLSLLEDTTARLVRDADELFAVTTEALGDFEPWLRTGEAPRVYDLWNVVPRSEALYLAESVAREEGAEDIAEAIGALRKTKRKEPTRHFPKDENHLADLALRFLRERLGERGVVVNREVEVQKGHATDLFVVAYVEDEEGRREIARVVVEVKSSWHSHIYKAMESQLADGYLDGRTRRHGVYLVGWFGSDRWFSPAPDRPHPKAKRARRGGMARLRRRLEDQAEALTREDARLGSVVVDCSLPPPRASGTSPQT
jgi:hypothetical protein